MNNFKTLMKVVTLLLVITVTSKPITVCANKYNKYKHKKYAIDNIIIYSKDSTKSEKIGTYTVNEKIKIVGISSDRKWYKVKYKFRTRYIENASFISNKKLKSYKWKGTKLNSFNGKINGPSGTETYYNLNMSTVVKIMREKGFDSKKYPYWVRDDGVKMLGRYVMVGANYKIHPKGSLVRTSLGTAIVCDTGDFAYSEPYNLDVAVTWR